MVNKPHVQLLLPSLSPSLLASHLVTHVSSGAETQNREKGDGTQRGTPSWNQTTRKSCLKY